MVPFFNNNKEQLQLDKNNIPKHIAIIMDGNGRWAAKRALPKKAGHRAGAKTLENISQAAIDLGIEHLTVYAFSTENWKRSEEEVKGIMDLLREYLKTAETHPVSGENRLFLKAQLPSGSIHDMRADYARDLYQYFEDRGDVATGKIYHCKGDMLGRSFDKGILSAVSYNLQHSRDNVVVNHYLWK